MLQLHDKIVLFLEELERLSTIHRLFHYGPLHYLALVIKRFLNQDIYEYVVEFLQKVDDVIVYFNTNTKYKISVNRKQIGELFNVSLEYGSDNTIAFFESLFESVNLFMYEILRAMIDEMFDKNFKIDKITSLNALQNADYKSDTFSMVRELIREYLKFMSNKPTAFSIFSKYKRFVLPQNVVQDYIGALEDKIVNYVVTKKKASAKPAILQ